jgi:Serine endopeptidase inhibitors
MNKKQSVPFFAKFLENQRSKEETEQAVGGATTKYPSDTDEAVTEKYPSDWEDNTKPAFDNIVTAKYPSDNDEDVSMKYPSDDDEGGDIM